ncbi:CMP-N-acetylneuraminate-beta-galactosamide-alpha-2,3-sialyltransferase 1-like isoform X2 [Poecilia reticulata]|uniref:CMP-N-acetylneuraminate-beta-galactosamide-alpha-2,3-sialyltransferase 1 n=1 Tax=Poecilia reticulata TaxID=8081 RepID=A0A3P9PQ86_POERE|nr:PREDICTED: CMP-N-acetylneuraminate-beta-galactosamide-alpha-2,3-sialyltransferase 1-like isoform X2 [Poecilia reticulata]
MTLTWKMLIFLFTLTAAGMFFKLDFSNRQLPINEQLPYKIAQVHRMQNRGSLDEKLEDQSLQEKSVMAKNIFPQDQNAQDKNIQEKTPCGCQKCFSKDDKFFMSCFKPSIEPFLSASTMLSLNVFMWWKRLQYERRDFNYYKTAVANLFKIFPPVPSLRKPSPGKCRTCAVVGNSVNLRGSSYGSLIDAHDIVIRMNGGPTTGYEKDVGTKTTHRVLYPESAVDLDNSTHLVVFAFKIQDLEWPTKALTTGFYTRSHRKVKQKINANKDLVMVVNPAFMKYVHEIWMKRRGTYPSTGFMTLILSLHVCDEVHVFGFGADSNRNWSHYFEVLKNKNYRTGPHSGSNEYTILKQLASEKTVTLYKGS